MSRGTIVLDRFVTLLVGLVLVVVGATAVVWQSDLWSRVSGPAKAPWLSTAVSKDWWPWAVGFGGLLLVVVGLRWLAAHIPHTGTGPWRLDGTDETGRLEVDLSAVAEAAATSLTAHPYVVSAGGKAYDDRGRRTVQIKATLDPAVDLTAAATAVDSMCSDLVTALATDAVPTRVQLSVGRHRPQRTRVE